MVPQTADEISDLLALAFAEETAAWHLDSTGGWARRHLAPDGTPLLDLQEHLIRTKQRKRSDPE